MFLWPCIMNWPYKTTNVMHWILFIRQILLLSSSNNIWRINVIQCITLVVLYGIIIIIIIMDRVAQSV